MARPYFNAARAHGLLLPCRSRVLEQETYGSKADIWSAGITLLEMAHGHAPFSKLSPIKVLLQTLQVGAWWVGGLACAAQAADSDVCAVPHILSSQHIPVQWSCSAISHPRVQCNHQASSDNIQQPWGFEAKQTP